MVDGKRISKNTPEKDKIMIIKVNQVTHANQIKSVITKINLVNFCITKGNNQSKKFLKIEDALEIMQKYPQVSYSFFFDETYEIEEQINIIKQNNIKYLELICPDVRMEEKFKNFMLKIEKIHIPIILSGFFLIKDDLSMLEDIDYYKKLMKNNVELFQFELGSIIDKEFLISKINQHKISDFFLKIPTIYTDNFLKIPLFNSKGIYFNLFYNDEDINYDLSSNTFSPSQVFRILNSKF